MTFKNHFAFRLFILPLAITLPGGVLFAQAFIPQLPPNTQVTQTITIKNVDSSSSSSKDEMTDEELEKELAKYLEEYKKQEKAQPTKQPAPQAKEPEPEKEDFSTYKKDTPSSASAQNESLAPKAKKQTATEPGKFVPFFQPGGDSVKAEPYEGTPLAPRPSGYAKRRPGRRPGSSHDSHFRPVNRPPVMRPVMVPGGNAGANPGSDPRLYMPPSGVKRPAPRPMPRSATGLTPARPIKPAK